MIVALVGAGAFLWMRQKEQERQQGRAVGLATAGHSVIAQRIEPVQGKRLAAAVLLAAPRQFQ